ncbi:radical SAM/SPASM domain-containing protein [Thermodesulfobacteriota bacterium]
MWETIKALNIEISAKCQANCPFCSRKQKVRPYGEHLITFDEFKRLPVPFIKQLRRISFGGNFGDLCCNPHVVDIASYVRQLNPNITLEGETNGSVQEKNWWKNLGKSFEKGCIVFSLDGLGDTHHIHRKGTYFEKVVENMQAFMSGGGIAYWKFIVFEHNEHQIKEAEALAGDINCSRFFVTASRDYNKNLRKPKTLDFRLKRNIFYSHWETLAAVDKHGICRPLDNRSLYIAADGTVHPCCFAHCMYVTEHNEMFRYIIPLVEKYRAEINFKTKPLAEITNSPYFSEVFSESKTNKYCGVKCNKHRRAITRNLVLYDKVFS